MCKWPGRVLSHYTATARERIWPGWHQIERSVWNHQESQVYVAPDAYRIHNTVHKNCPKIRTLCRLVQSNWRKGNTCICESGLEGSRGLLHSNGGILNNIYLVQRATGLNSVEGKVFLSVVTKKTYNLHDQLPVYWYIRLSIKNRVFGNIKMSWSHSCGTIVHQGDQEDKS